MSTEPKAYSYATLRYFPDVSTQEFVNVGVVVVCPEQKFVKVKVLDTTARFAHMFPGLDHGAFKSVMAQIKRKSAESSMGSLAPLPFTATPDSAYQFAISLYPQDDSSLRWHASGVGMTSNPGETTEALFKAFVIRYVDHAPSVGTSDKRVWPSFTKPLRRHGILGFLRPWTFRGPAFNYEFPHVWQNGIPHALHPVSLDLARADSLSAKAAMWRGRCAAISASGQEMELYFLLKRPRKVGLAADYREAERMLKDGESGSLRVELVESEQAESFCDGFARKIHEYSGQTDMVNLSLAPRSEPDQPPSPPGK